jgi:hypothetical protein
MEGVMHDLLAEIFFNACYDMAWADFGWFGRRTFDIYWFRPHYLFARWNEERSVLDEYPLTRYVDRKTGKMVFI